MQFASGGVQVCDTNAGFELQFEKARAQERLVLGQWKRLFCDLMPGATRLGPRPRADKILHKVIVPKASIRPLSPKTWGLVAPPDPPVITWGPETLGAMENIDNLLC